MISAGDETVRRDHWMVTCSAEAPGAKRAIILLYRMDSNWLPLCNIGPSGTLNLEIQSVTKII